MNSRIVLTANYKPIDLRICILVWNLIPTSIHDHPLYRKYSTISDLPSSSHLQIHLLNH